MNAKKNSPKNPPAEGPSDADPIVFEAALEELETLVDRMEAGDMSLDESLKAFERGVTLARQCQGALQAAELRVAALNDQGELEELDSDEFDDA